jgi:glycosyltransferase involved in cell wall biosynthesis
MRNNTSLKRKKPNASPLIPHPQYIKTLIKKDCSDIHTFAVLMHGDSPFLEDCLKSLLEQQVKSTIILVSSTPSEYQQQLAISYGLPYIINPVRKNIASDWNFAMARTETPYVTLAHQDDLYTDSYTQTMLGAFINQKEGLICFSDYHQHQYGQESHRPLLLKIKRLILSVFFGFGVSGYKLSGTIFKRLLLGFGNPICCPTVMYHRDNTSSILFDDNFKVNLDWKCWIDLADTRGSFVFVPQDLLGYRAHEQTSTNLALDSGARQTEDLRCFRLLWPRPIASLLSRLYSLSYSRAVR